MKKSYWFLIGIIILLVLIAGVFFVIKKTGKTSEAIDGIDPALQSRIDAMFSDLAKEGEVCGGIEEIQCIEGFYCEPEMEFIGSPGICVKNFE
ncbi:hypothetical protein HOD88_01205 [archaeon]|jgi:hypothetical protein|nr:hypothetical protein [archaeon]